MPRQGEQGRLRRDNQKPRGQIREERRAQRGGVAARADRVCHGGLMKPVLLACWVTCMLLLAAAPPASAREPAEESARHAGLSLELKKTGAAHVTLTLHSEFANPPRVE